MVNGLALQRAAAAAQTQAASTKNPTPVHSEDLQPNETLRKRKGAGLPPVVATVVGSRRQVARRGGRSTHEGRDWIGQAQERVERGSVGHVNRAGEYRQAPWKTQDGRRPRPIPLPIPSSQSPNLRASQISSASSQSTAGEAVNTNGPNEKHTKPFSLPLPALRRKVPWSGLSTALVPKPVSTITMRSRAEATESRSPSPKRRKVDLTPEFVSPISSNITRKSVITNMSPLCARPIPLPLSPSQEQKKINGHTLPPAFPSLPSPRRRSSLATQAPGTTQIQVKREPESPPLRSPQRQSVTSQYQFYPFPDNCNRTHLKWEANRIAFRKEKERELESRGLEIIGKCITRGDGISIQWKSDVPVWSDTLEPEPETPKKLEESMTSIYLPPASSFTAPEADAEHQAPNVPIPPSPEMSPSDIPALPPLSPLSPTVATSFPQKSPQTSVLTRAVPTAPPSPDPKPQASLKRKRQLVPRASLDLATAIQLSQRNNASPKSPVRRLTTSSSGRSTASPATKRLPSLGPALSKLPPETPTKASKAQAPGRRPRPKSHLAKKQVAVLDVEDEALTKSPVLGETPGWTVIQEIAEPDSSDRVEEVEEEQDQLVEEDELREEMEAAEVASIGTPHDESDDERDEVESEAIPIRHVSSPTVNLMPGEETMEPTTGESLDNGSDFLSRGFLTRYMQLFETDRAGLLSAYGPDAKFIYRVFDCSPTSPDPARSSPMLSQSEGRSFPLRTARGHAEISSSLQDLQTRFSQKLDEDRNNTVDAEFWSERSGEEIWLYVRSVMTVDDAPESSQGKKWNVDHSFLLRKVANEGAEDDVAEKGGWPVVAHVHQLMMHERPL